MKFKIALLFSCVLFSWGVIAQQFTKKKQYISVDISYISSYFAGKDISFTSNKFITAGVGASVQKRIKPRISLGFNYSYQVPRAQKEIEIEYEGYNYYRYVGYKAQINSIGGFAMIDLMENRGTFLKRASFTPYLNVGIEGVHVLQKEKENVNYRKISHLEKTTFAIPVGVGFRYKLSRVNDLAIEFIHYFSSSSDIDFNVIHKKTTDKNDQWFAIKIKLSSL